MDLLLCSLLIIVIHSSFLQLIFFLHVLYYLTLSPLVLTFFYHISLWPLGFCLLLIIIKKSFIIFFLSLFLFFLSFFLLSSSRSSSSDANMRASGGAERVVEDRYFVNASTTASLPTSRLRSHTKGPSYRISHSAAGRREKGWRL